MNTVIGRKIKIKKIIDAPASTLSGVKAQLLVAQKLNAELQAANAALEEKYNGRFVKPDAPGVLHTSIGFPITLGGEHHNVRTEGIGAKILPLANGELACVVFIKTDMGTNFSQTVHIPPDALAAGKEVVVDCSFSEYTP